MVIKPFYPLNKKKIVGLNMQALLGTKAVKGDIGLEIEVEGNKFPKDSIPAPWGYHKDGSLRGQDNAEYVLKHPIPFEKVPDAIGTLWQMFTDYGSVLDESNRTSVHVHLNAQRFHLTRLTSFLALYFSVEELLAAWCGDHRVGNLFCLRGRDAPAIITNLKKFIVSDGQYEIKDGMHYAGLNAQALYKFGSIEIRTLRGVNDPKTILDWVAILERIYKLSADFPDPREIPSLLSGEGPLNYLDMVLGDHAVTVKNGIDYSIDRIRDALYDGIRLAQDLCYCRDWSLYIPTDAKDDPFGRDAKKVANNLQAFVAAYGEPGQVHGMQPGQLMPVTTASQYLHHVQNQTIQTAAQQAYQDALQTYNQLSANANNPAADVPWAPPPPIAAPAPDAFTAALDEIGFEDAHDYVEDDE